MPDFQTFASTLGGSAIEMAESAFKREGQLTGTPTGFKRLNELLGGLQPSDLIILAGRPAMGKTALATNIAFNAAKSRGAGAKGKRSRKHVVAFYSLEMSSEQLALTHPWQNNRASRQTGSGVVRLTSTTSTKCFEAAEDLSRLEPVYRRHASDQLSRRCAHAPGRLLRTEKRLDLNCRGLPATDAGRRRTRRGPTTGSRKFQRSPVA